MKFDQVLKVAVHGGASDIILKLGSLPRFRHDGRLVSLTDGKVISPEIMQEWIHQVVPQSLLAKLTEDGDCDFAYELSKKSRFRVNVFKQQKNYGMVLRVLSNHIKTLEELQMPKIIQEFTKAKRGLILVTGATGSGKTTTLAAMIEKINIDRSAHIITIEDPIEFLFSDKNSTINQREIGTDVRSFASALKASLRQSPDVILVGELRDKETTETALMAAETGHLVISTLHTVDAVDSLTRLMSYFSPHQHTAIRNQLANTLNAVVSQRLVNRIDNIGRVPALEIMVVNSLIRDCIIKENSFTPIADAIQRGNESYGMQSFDQSLLQLYQKKVISKEQAIDQATSRENMKLLISGVSR
ncbi:MAG: PilT/PilU family type 4a pilus ATPase [Bdellovibrionota bacterium]